MDNSPCGEDLLPSKVTVDIIDGIGYNSHVFEDILKKTMVSGGENMSVMWSTTSMVNNLEKKQTTSLYLQISSPHVKFKSNLPNLDLRGSNRTLGFCGRVWR